MNKLSTWSKSLTRNTLLASLLLLPRITEAQLHYNLPWFITPHTFEDLLLAILNIFLVIATPIIVLFIIYAGFLYVTARGNAEQTQQATRAITYAVIGGVLVIGSVALAAVVRNVVASFTP